MNRLIVELNRGHIKKQEWKYRECKLCSILYPHLAVPEICICGNNMKKNSNKKTLKLIEFNEVRNSSETRT